MSFLKNCALLSVMIYTSACQAENQKYMDCDWNIPSGYSQKAEREYSNSVDENDLENWVPASILFTAHSGTEQHYYESQRLGNNDDVLLLEHSKQAGDKFNYVSSFLRQESFGIPFIVAKLSIIKDDEMLVISGLPKADALALTSGCAEFSQIEQHYLVLQQIKSDYKTFLKSDHGMRVLVP